MTTIRQLITDGLRESGVLAAGETPEADIFDEALRKVNTLYRGLLGAELGEPLKTVNYGKAGLSNTFSKNEDMSSDVNAVYFPENIRLLFNIEDEETIYLHPNPNDGARIAVIDNGGNFATYNVTLNGNGRQIESADTVALATNSLAREWFYRADLGNWMRVSDLEADTESPFPSEFDDLITTLLAFRLNPRFAAQTSEEMSVVLRRIRSLFRARYRQVAEQTSEDGLLYLTSNRPKRRYAL